MVANSRDLVIAGLLRRLARMQQLLIVARILNETLDLETLLRYIVETAADLTQTEAGSVLLLDSKGEHLRFAAATNIKPSALRELTVPMENSVAGWVLTTGKAMTIPDIHRADFFYEGVDEVLGFHTRSIMAVPLEIHERRIGVLEVVNKIGDRPFTDDDMESLMILGTLAAVSIENARLFQQSDLISDVVHELRTPLTSIIGYSKMLLMMDNVPAAMQKQFLETIHREASRLGDMVNTYLDLARLESGRAQLHREDVDLNEAAREAAELMHPQAAERDIELTLELSAPACTAHVDKARLHQVLVNLLSNAIKYNRPGGKVHLAVTPIGGQARIRVQDTGEGIPPDILPYIFDKFFRGEEKEGQAKGTGLGLSIAKQIVEMHGGSIEVQSVPGEGSTFTVILPLETS
ncbi:MAG: GAF domain-containing sensor histidine kinase [Anaerolineae bacterium]|nr:GAF domain-containing sensor histidine kinase [Anaerolineae bacterium]